MTHLFDDPNGACIGLLCINGLIKPSQDVRIPRIDPLGLGNFSKMFDGQSNNRQSEDDLNSILAFLQFIFMEKSNPIRCVIYGRYYCSWQYIVAQIIKESAFTIQSLCIKTVKMSIHFDILCWP